MNELVYFAGPSIVVLIDEAINIRWVWRVRRSHRLDPCVIRSPGLIASASDRPGWRESGLPVAGSGGPNWRHGGYLVTDGLGCFRLLAWIIDEQPNASRATINRRFDALFHGNKDAAFNAVRCVFDGTWNKVPGEEAYFCGQLWRNHPREMHAIASLGLFYQAGLIR